MDSEIEVTQAREGGCLILRLVGRLDAVTSPGVEKDVSDMIDGDELKILMNFKGVSYLSSAGMRMLLATTKKLKMLSGKLVVSDVDPNVMDVLKMSGFDHVIDLVASEEEGIKHFAG